MNENRIGQEGEKPKKEAIQSARDAVRQVLHHRDREAERSLGRRDLDRGSVGEKFAEAASAARHRAQTQVDRPAGSIARVGGRRSFGGAVRGNASERSCTAGSVYMGILTWIVFGLIAGAVARWLLPAGPGGVLGDVIVGILGALIGGFIYNFFGHAGVTGFNLWSFGCAILGAIVLLAIIRLFGGGAQTSS